MKKLLLSAAAMAVSGFLAAQTFVSTSPENKNVVLEEYTGIYCTFCPDGHKRAAALKDQNPGDVVLINIHTGSFANPSGGDPDFRTQWGSALANQSGLTGYPAGSINRVNFSSNGWAQGSGTAMSRGDWTNASNVILGESSPVNVAVKATYDDANNEVDIEVEAYYTGNDYASATNKLNVYILQNNIPGPQTGASTYWPEMILPNGQYRHMHMLRDMVTGQWGEDIVNPGMGTFVSKSYSWSIPSNINGVPVLPQDLEVAVSIAEGQQVIISGDVAVVTLPSNIKTDLSSADQTSVPSDYCATSVDPQIEITNNYTNTITSFDVDVFVNGTSAGTESYSGSLATGQSTTLTFSGVSLNPGSNTIGFSAPYNINGGGLIDTNAINNLISSPTILQVPATPTAAPKGFEFDADPIGSIPSDLYEDNPAGDRLFAVNSGISSTVTWNLGGFGNSDGCLRWDFPLIDAGNAPAVFTEKLDFSNIEEVNVTFSHAHAQWATEADEFDVSFSTDCGNTWTSIWNKSGSDLSTAPPLSGDRFYPQINEWVGDSIMNVQGVAGESEVIFKFTGTSDAGNALYVDDINIGGYGVSVDELSAGANLSIYPNPSNGNVFITTPFDNATVEIFDALGNRVAVTNLVGAGNQEIASDLAAGVYVINVTANGETYQEKLMVK